MTDNFSRDLVVSVLGHACIVLLIFVRAITMPSERLDLRSAIRVDVVGLPQKIQELPEKAPEKPAPIKTAKETAPKAKAEVKPAKTKAPEVSLDKKKSHEKSQKAALEKLKAMEALDKIKDEVGKEHAKKSKPTVVAGNQVSAGNALSGMDRIDFDRYFDELTTKVRGQWSIPQWLADQDFKAQVLVLIDERGYVIKKVFRKSSGSEIFDAKALEAIDNSAPLPPPPQRLRGILSTSGIVFNFPQ